MDSNEITRLLLNLIRKGSVVAVDHDAALCRVKTGELTTNWIPFFARRAGSTRTWSPATVGEQVMLFSPGGDMADAVALCGIYSDAAPAPSKSPSLHVIDFPDGAAISYDHEAHALTATLPGGGTAVLEAPASVTVISQAVTIDAPQTTCTGNLTVQKKLTYLGGMSGKGGSGAAAQIEGAIAATLDITAGGISLQNHTHREQGDGNNTSKAQ